jgi:hypothetical protein
VQKEGRRRDRNRMTSRDLSLPTLRGLAGPTPASRFIPLSAFRVLLVRSFLFPLNYTPIHGRADVYNRALVSVFPPSVLRRCVEHRAHRCPRDGTKLRRPWYADSLLPTKYALHVLYAIVCA